MRTAAGYLALLAMLGLTSLRLQVGNSFLQGPSHGSGYRTGNPRLVIVHSLECDANEGLAVGLNSGPGSYIWTAGVSPHTLSDPGTTRGACDTDLVGYHIGNGNPYALGSEVTGRAAWSTEQWLSANANKALERQAIALAHLCHAAGFTAADIRWLSLREVADGSTRGIATHNDISTAPWGFSIGTNHWDPGPGYPYAIQMTRIRYYFGCLDYWGEDVPVHSQESDYPGQGGGAQPITKSKANFPFIVTSENPSPHVLVEGGVAQIITDGRTTASLTVSGVPFAVISATDFDAVLARYGEQNN